MERFGPVLLLPDYEEQRILEDIKSGGLETIEDVNDRFKEIKLQLLQLRLGLDTLPYRPLLWQ